MNSNTATISNSKIEFLNEAALARAECPSGRFSVMELFTMTDKVIRIGIMDDEIIPLIQLLCRGALNADISIREIQNAIDGCVRKKISDILTKLNEKE